MIVTTADAKQARIVADFPILHQTDVARQAPRLPRLGCHLAETAGGHRRARPLLRERQREHPPRRVRARRARDRRFRSRAREGRALRQRRAHGRDHLDPQHDRSDQPRLVLVGAGRTSARATRSSPRNSSITRTSCRGSCSPPRPVRELRFIPVDGNGVLVLDDLDALLDGVKLVALSHISNTLGSIAPLAPDRPARARRRCRSCWSTPRNRSRTCRSTCRRSTSTSSLPAATRCAARPGSASCTESARCSKRCRRSSPAAT